MQIQDEHLYHGAALNQIAENKRFTTINALKINGIVSRGAYRINDSTAVHLKYAAQPKGQYNEYQFTFNKHSIKEIRKISEYEEKLYLSLVCVGAKEICCISQKDFARLLEARRGAVGRDEDQVVVLVTLKKNQAFRAYVNAPKLKGKCLNPKLTIARNNFPKQLLQ